MASSKEIQRILTCLQTSILDKPETLPSSALNDVIAGIRHHALLSSTASATQSSFQEYLKTINGFLRSSSERPLGLRLLKETLRQFLLKQVYDLTLLHVPKFFFECSIDLSLVLIFVIEAFDS